MNEETIKAVGQEPSDGRDVEGRPAKSISIVSVERLAQDRRVARIYLNINTVYKLRKENGHLVARFGLIFSTTRTVQSKTK